MTRMLILSLLLVAGVFSGDVDAKEYARGTAIVERQRQATLTKDWPRMVQTSEDLIAYHAQAHVERSEMLAGAHLNRAQALAQLGRGKEALAALRGAMLAGHWRIDLLRNDERLAPLRTLSGWSALVERSEPPATVLGDWRSTGEPDPLAVRIEGRRLLFRAGDGPISVFPCRWVGDGFAGQEVSFLCTTGKNGLSLTRLTTEGRRKIDFRRPPAGSPALELKPFPIPASAEAPAAVIKQVQEELARRVAKDQAVRKGGDAGADMAKVDEDNTAWLKARLGEVGWIDHQRFGATAAKAAFLIVQHSGDLPLMVAVLPLLEAELRSGANEAKPGKGAAIDPQNYCLLYDRTHLRLGDGQRYGTQLQFEDNALLTAVLLPMEKFAPNMPVTEIMRQLEQNRTTIGLFPFMTYLESIAQLQGKMKMEVSFTEY